MDPLLYEKQNLRPDPTKVQEFFFHPNFVLPFSRTWLIDNGRWEFHNQHIIILFQAVSRLSRVFTSRHVSASYSITFPAPGFHQSSKHIFWTTPGGDFLSMCLGFANVNPCGGWIRTVEKYLPYHWTGKDGDSITFEKNEVRGKDLTKRSYSPSLCPKRHCSRQLWAQIPRQCRYMTIEGALEVPSPPEE
jgi:hypothetical protein